jgi:hypothetical protein
MITIPMVRCISTSVPIKLFKINYGQGLLRDIGYIQGFNFDSDSNVYKILPGIRFSWNIPGFAFLNTDWMAYLDASSGVSPGTQCAGRNR